MSLKLLEAPLALTVIFFSTGLWNDLGFRDSHYTNTQVPCGISSRRKHMPLKPEVYWACSTEGITRLISGLC